MEQCSIHNMQEAQPLLSICIPIYNRLSFLQKMLERFMEDKHLFESEIELIISDNCSEDDLGSCVSSFQKRGLPIFYHRQENNLGPDGNFNYCFKQAHGKYMWLLGSDDIPLRGILPLLMSHLRVKDYGLFHFRKSPDGKSLYREYEDNNEILADINVQITFMSANIISTDRLAQLNVMNYAGTYLLQVPVFMDACLSKRHNAICLLPEIFEPISDTAHTGDYDLFGVMVRNLFAICQDFVNDGRLSRKGFEKLKKAEFKDYITSAILSNLILRKKNNYILTNAWEIIFKNYGTKVYSYYYFIRKCVLIIIRKIKLGISRINALFQD